MNLQVKNQTINEHQDEDFVGDLQNKSDMKTRKVTIKDLNLEKLIGQGAFGEAHLINHLKDFNIIMNSFFINNIYK